MQKLNWESLRFKNIISYPDYQIEENKMTFISGDSGTGKSTLLKLLNNTITPQTGTIYYNASNISTLNPNEYRQKVSLLGQTPYLFDETIKENFRRFYEFRDLSPLSDQEIIENLKLCKIELPLDKKTSELSGGEKQRISLAISISFKPDVLLLDEPTSALDEKTSMELMTNIKSLGITTLIISHSKDLIEMYADDIYYLSKNTLPK